MNDVGLKKCINKNNSVYSRDEEWEFLSGSVDKFYDKQWHLVEKEIFPGNKIKYRNDFFIATKPNLME